MFLVLPYVTYGIEVWFGAYNNNTDWVYFAAKRAVGYICLLKELKKGAYWAILSSNATSESVQCIRTMFAHFLL